MPPEAASATAGVAISDVLGVKERSPLQRLFSSQAFWVTIAVALIMVIMSAIYPTAYATSANLYNITRNFSFIGIMALGMTAVIITGGIDLSVGSIMGVVGIVVGVLMHANFHWIVAVAGGLLAGAACGAINGVLITYVGLPSFVVTLGTLQAFRSVAVILSQNKMIYQFGPWGNQFFNIFGSSILGIDVMTWVLLVMAIGFALVLHFTQWGRHLFAVGGNEHAAQLTGVPVNRVKMLAYMASALTAAIAAIFVLGWQGSAINALGTGYELRVIAATVIGGANLMGGEGGAYGAFIGAALIEVIRNSLVMAGVDSNYQGIFVGAFIVLAVLLERIRGRKRE